MGQYINITQNSRFGILNYKINSYASFFGLQKQSHVPREGRTYKPKKREGKNMPAFTFADLEKNADELKVSMAFEIACWYFSCNF